MAVSFNDIQISFSDDEWKLLTKEQRQLYWETLQENYSSLLFIGGWSVHPKDVFGWIENNKRALQLSPQFLWNLPPEIRSRDETPPQMDEGSVPEQVGPLEGICKEDTDCSKAEGHPGPPCASATEQGSGMPQTESREQASGHVHLEYFLPPCYVWIELLPIPVPVVVPAMPVELHFPRMPVLPRCDLATGAARPFEEMPLAGATCDEKSADPRWQAVATAPARQARKRLLAPPSPLGVPAKKKNLYFCAWCDEPFKLQINLEVHYRYCRQKQNQGLLLKGEKTPGGQDASGSNNTWNAAGSVLLPRKPAQRPSSSGGQGPLLPPKPGQPQQKQGVARNKYTADAGKGISESRRKLLATVAAMKTLYRCPECGEKFVYKWQLLAHLRSCEGDEDDVIYVGTKFQGPAAEGLPNRAEAETEEPCFVPEARPSTSQDSGFYPYGKNLSKSYLPTHRAVPEEQRYKCLWCGKVFPFQSMAQEHQQLHYKEGEDNHCPRCGKKARYNGCSCMIGIIRAASDSDDEE